MGRVEDQCWDLLMDEGKAGCEGGSDTGAIGDDPLGGYGA